MTRTDESRVRLFLGLGGAVAAAALVAFVTFGASGSSGTSVMAAEPGLSKVAVQTLSTDASRVTGGDVLVQITVPSGTPAQPVKVTVAGRDVSDAFRATASNTMVGLVTGCSGAM